MTCNILLLKCNIYESAHYFFANGVSSRLETWTWLWQLTKYLEGNDSTHSTTNVCGKADILMCSIVVIDLHKCRKDCDRVPICAPNPSKELGHPLNGFISGCLFNLRPCVSTRYVRLTSSNAALVFFASKIVLVLHLFRSIDSIHIDRKQTAWTQ